jgi:hypothetical protein
MVPPGTRTEARGGLNRISGLAARFLAHMLYFGNTLVLSEPKRGWQACASTAECSVTPAPWGTAMPAFGESCRRRGHALVSLTDPELTQTVHRSTSESVAAECTTLVRSGYSITSSALSRIDCGTVSPSALAVLRLTTISNFVGN